MATGMASLCRRRSGCLSKVTMTANISAADVNDTARIVIGGISVSINFTAGQLRPHNTPISRKAKMSIGLMFGCKVRVQCSRCSIETLLSFYRMNQRAHECGICCLNPVSTVHLYFNSNLLQALDLLSVFDKVVDMDDAHRINAPQLVNLAVMCLENCRQRTYRLGVVKLLQKPINPCGGVLIKIHQKTIPNRQHYNTPKGVCCVVLPKMGELRATCFLNVVMMLSCCLSCKYCFRRLNTSCLQVLDGCG